jgi:hypothetical protein
MNSMAEKGRIWRFKLQGHLPVSEHGLSSSLSEPVYEAFSTLSCLEDQMACQVWRFLSARVLQISLQQLHLGLSFYFTGFYSGKKSSESCQFATLQAWIEHTTWTRVTPSLEQDATYRALTGDNSLKCVQVYASGRDWPAVLAR